MLEASRVDLDYDESGFQHMLLDGEDVSREIRLPDHFREALLFK